MIIFCNIYKAVNLRIDCFFYRRNKKGRNPSPTKVAISTRPLRQYYDTENYQNCIFFIILVMIFYASGLMNIEYIKLGGGEKPTLKTPGVFSPGGGALQKIFWGISLSFCYSIFRRIGRKKR